MYKALFVAAILISPTANAMQCDISEALHTAQQLELQIQSQHLDNGIQLYWLPMANKQTVTIASQFNVGSRNEGKGQTGYAHLFEHLLFKGSDNAPENTYPNTMNGIGARFNASTHFDYTNYYATIPSHAIELALFLESDRFRRPIITPASVENQQGAVIEEMASTIDSQPFFRVAMEFLLAQVSDTPYGHAIIGNKQDVLGATASSLQAFHQQYYQPNKMTMAVVGDVPSDIYSKVEAHFGDWQAQTTLAHTFAPIDIQAKPVHGKVYDNRGPWPALLLAWHTRGRSHPDAAALALLNQYLFSHNTSLMQHTQRNEAQALFNYSFPMAMDNHGVANIVLVPRAKVSLDDLFDLVTKQIEQVISEGIDANSLCRIKHSSTSTLITQFHQPQTVAKRLINIAQQDLDQPLSGPISRIDAVTNEDIQRVAQQYFQHKTIRLDLFPPWYIRTGKTVLEWLPESLTHSLEDKAL
ncbi:M16 family metallopeptidase [Shewanella maritima]|uniref:M16 family metallopeptidase n=1 Tax=Shewanella maritima TaxID=2520507 RepID=UPI003736A1D4